ncbi:tetratricopeptide repeat protein [Neptunicella sp. SCSIO 80796]|uniref:tetratricopeptide repeat protein n=1 Tax=Neptunicella plasticusilytica TaxID=3117012 RepID=UPI003A4E42F2
MSVINKMLQDLDARESNQSNTANYVEPAKRYPWMWLVLVALLIIAAVLVAKWWWTRPAVSSATGQSQVESLPRSTVVKNMPVVKQVNRSEPLQPQIDTTVASTETQPDIPESNAVVESENAEIAEPQTQDVAKTDQEEPVVTEQQQTATHSSFSMQPAQLTAEQEIARLESEIQLALSEQNIGEAIKGLLQLIEQSPQHSKARQKLANLYNEQGKPLLAEQILRAGLALTPDDAPQRLMLARLLTQEKHPQQALSLLQEVNPDIALYQEYYIYLATLAQQSGNDALAMQTYLDLTRVATDNAKWWLGLAVSADRLANKALAISSYHKALNLAQLDKSVQAFIRQRIAVLGG